MADSKRPQADYTAALENKEQPSISFLPNIYPPSEWTAFFNDPRVDLYTLDCSTDCYSRLAHVATYEYTHHENVTIWCPSMDVVLRGLIPMPPKDTQLSYRADVPAVFRTTVLGYSIMAVVCFLWAVKFSNKADSRRTVVKGDLLHFLLLALGDLSEVIADMKDEELVNTLIAKLRPELEEGRIPMGCLGIEGVMVVYCGERAVLKLSVVPPRRLLEL